MKNKVIWLAMAFVVSLIVPTEIRAIESENLSAILKHADSIRTSDPKLFSQELAKVRIEFDSLSINEKYYFLYLAGYEYALSGDVENSVKNYLHVFENSQQIELKYRVALSLVNVYAFTRDWAEGYKYLNFIDEFKDQILHTSIRHQGLIAASIFYNEIRDFAVTIDYMKSVISESQSERNTCSAQGILLKAQLSSGIEFESDNAFQNVIERCHAIGEVAMANVIRSYLGLYYLDNNNGKLAVDSILPNLKAIEDSSYGLLKIDIYSILSRGYWTQGEKELAVEYALKAIDESENSSVIRPIVAVYEVLYKIAIENKDYLSAVKYLEQFALAQKEQFSSENARQLAFESAKRQAIEKDNQITLLNKQNTILQLENALSEETATYNRWLIVLLTLIVGMLVMWVIYVKRSQQKLKYLAEYDSLTGISNRAYFTQSAETVLNYYSKTSRTACLVLFDLDHFKKVNDTYGHPAGDKVLEIVAVTCKASVRKVDIFGRVGGEEFAILLPGCEIDQAIKIAEDCRKRIAEIDPNELGIESPITASFGIAESSSTGYLLKDLIANADEAMYLAKRRGRNRVVSYSPD